MIIQYPHLQHGDDINSPHEIDESTELYKYYEVSGRCLKNSILFQGRKGSLLQELVEVNYF